MRYGKVGMPSFLKHAIFFEKKQWIVNTFYIRKHALIKKVGNPPFIRRIVR